jgi:hypothetical protein
VRVTGAIAPETTIVATSEHASCEVNGEAVVLALRQGVYYGLNAVGARVWSLIQEPRTLTDVCDAIERAFDVDRRTCERDVARLVEELAERGLVELR